MSKSVPRILIAVIVAAVVLGGALRANLDLPLSLDGIQDWVAGHGWLGPPVFLFLVVFRQFLALPAFLLLSVGGLCFGTLAGGTLGALGIVLSGTMKFALARGVGRDWLRQRSSARLARAEALAQRLGPAVVAVTTAHPLGPLSPVHWAAGLSALTLPAFVGALILGAPLRAFAFSFFGESLVDASSIEFRIAAAVLAASVLLPLALFPGRVKAFFRGDFLADATRAPSSTRDRAA